MDALDSKEFVAILKDAYEAGRRSDPFPDWWAKRVGEEHIHLADTKKRVTVGYKLLDLISEIRGSETLTIQHFPVNQVQFTLTRTKAEDDEGIKTTSVMPANHHCDIERIMDVIRFLHQRLDKIEEETDETN